MSKYADIFNDRNGTGTGSTDIGTGSAETDADSTDTSTDSTDASIDSADPVLTLEKELLPACESQPYEYRISESVLYVIVQLKKPFHLKSKGSASVCVEL